METALYFPKAIRPDSSWLMQVALYWDGAASIDLAQRDPDDYRPFGYMDELVRADLVTLIRPREALGMSAQAFAEGFLAMLDGQKLPKPSHTNAVVYTGWDYMSYDLLRELYARNLALPLQLDDEPLRQFEDTNMFTTGVTIAELFMTYLVGLICRANSELFPVTDSTESLGSLASPATDLVPIFARYVTPR